MRKSIAIRVIALLFFTMGHFATAQPTGQIPAGKLLLELEKLDVLGSVLYIAAHPDDENTRLLSYLANERKVRTAYLSLTRGDGGQNLIGKEQGELLGMIRTQELTLVIPGSLLGLNVPTARWIREIAKTADQEKLHVFILRVV